MILTGQILVIPWCCFTGNTGTGGVIGGHGAKDAMSTFNLETGRERDCRYKNIFVLEDTPMLYF